MQSNASVANAYVADITPPEDRAKRFGLLGAMFGLGFILGPVMGGLLGAIDLHLPFFAAGALALLNLLYGWFVLPGVAAAREAPALRVAIGEPGDVVARALADEGRRPARRRDRVQRAGPVRSLHDLGAVHDLQVRLGAAAERLVAVRGRHRVGRHAGAAARPAAEALLAAAAGVLGPGVVDRVLPALRPRDRGLDDVRGDLREPARLHRHRVDPEHHLARRRCAAPRARRWAP